MEKTKAGYEVTSVITSEDVRKIAGDMMREHNKIGAIIQLRKEFKIGLHDAKRIIEEEFNC